MQSGCVADSRRLCLSGSRWQDGRVQRVGVQGPEQLQGPGESPSDRPIKPPVNRIRHCPDSPVHDPDNSVLGARCYAISNAVRWGSR